MTPFQRGFCRGFEIGNAVGLPLLIALLCGCSMQDPPLATRIAEMKAGERMLIVPAGSKLAVRSTAHGVLHLDAGTVEIEALPAEPSPIPPNPSPTPGPKPPAPAPLPDGKHGLAKWVRAEAEKLDRPSRAAEAKAVAEQVEAVAAKLVAGGYSTALWALSDLDGRIEQALGGSESAAYKVWQPLFAAAGEKVQGLQLKALSDFGEALKELAQGLESVR